MANAALYIKWGRPISGRETKSLEVFGQAMEYQASLVKQGKLAAQRTYVATTGEMHKFGGFIVLEGDVAQLRAVVDSEEWKMLRLRAEHVVEHIDVVHMLTGDEVQGFIGQVLNVRKQLGIGT
jgi:hypothetical protein